jgi:HPt (histidine-containing phosphotransfer) domain-containing protein
MDTVTHITQADPAIIDVAGCAQKLGIKEEHAQILLTNFVETLPDEEAALRAAYDSGNIILFINALHRLNGALHYIGLPALQQVGLDTEEAARQTPDLQTLRPFYQNILHQIKVVEREHLKFNPAATVSPRPLSE